MVALCDSVLAHPEHFNGYFFPIFPMKAFVGNTKRPTSNGEWWMASGENGKLINNSMGKKAKHKFTIHNVGISFLHSIFGSTSHSRRAGLMVIIFVFFFWRYYFPFTKKNKFCRPIKMGKNHFRCATPATAAAAVATAKAKMVPESAGYKRKILHNFKPKPKRGRGRSPFN